jgi:hypothetical protein
MGWTTITADARITTHPALLHGLVLLVSSDGGDVTVYEGQDVTSGRKVGRFEAKTDTSRPIHFNPALECERGIYVDVGSNVTEVLIHWSPRG